MKEQSRAHWHKPESYTHFSPEEDALLGKLQSAADLTALKDVFQEAHVARMANQISSEAYDRIEVELTRLVLVMVEQMLTHMKGDKSRRVVKEYVMRIFNPEENKLYDLICAETEKLVQRIYPRPQHDHNSL